MSDIGRRLEKSVSESGEQPEQAESGSTTHACQIARLDQPHVAGRDGEQDPSPHERTGPGIDQQQPAVKQPEQGQAEEHGHGEAGSGLERVATRPRNRGRPVAGSGRRVRQ